MREKDRVKILQAGGNKIKSTNELIDCPYLGTLHFICSDKRESKVHSHRYGSMQEVF